MGTSPSHHGMDFVNEDHPHAYGDKVFDETDEVLKRGSSPRVWGQVDININAQKTPRIIPTRMGTSDWVTHRLDKWEDHPHAYGDKVVKAYTIFCYMGSSPRVWGQEDNTC